MKKIFSLIVAGLLLFTASNCLAQSSEPDDDAKYATELLKPGVKAPDFKASTIDGKTLKFSKFAKGKYVVLDFWASWCPDCRKDAPNVVKMYEEYSKYGVEFIGVSFDVDREKWIAGVEKLNIPYIQVGELVKMSQSPIAAMYGVKWIPSVYLIGPDGKVVVSTVLSYKIEKKLEEIFKDK